MRAVVLGLMVAGCAGTPFDAHLASPNEPLRSCAHWYEALDQAVDAAAVRDAQYPRVSGFPYLRVSRYLSSLRDHARASDSALRVWSDRLLELDLEARRFEMQNLPEWSGSRDAALKRTADCGRLLRDADVANPAARGELIARAVVPHEDSPARVVLRAAPVPNAAGQRVTFAPPPAGLPRSTVAGMLALARLDPLGQPLLTERAFEQVAATYAPSVELVVASDYDRFGQLRWLRRQVTPYVDAAEPVLYVQPAYARLGERTLLQVVYMMWFPSSQLDGLVWRVTLSPEGEPLLYDSMLACGCHHQFFPTALAKPEATVGLPRVAEGERPLVRLGADHAVEGVSLVSGNDSLVRYGLRAYDELRSLRTLEGTHRSVFGPRGVIAGGQSAGAARQWGRQATDADGRPHFDDADLIEKRFTLVIP